MQTPTARLLELLELLQARPLTTGREISTHLEIDARTVRRYVAALQDLGIPVEGQRGVGGGYRVRPGYRLPPLMLSGDEAVVVVLGLIAARRQGLASEAASVDGALEKLHRVLPDPLRRRVEALEATLGFTTAPRAGAPVASDCGAPPRRGRSPRASREDRLPRLRRRADAARAQPLRARRPRRPVVPRRARPPARRPPHAQDRPHERPPDDAGAGAATARRGSTRSPT